jgi:4-alpha-glucanotransferase
VTNLQALGELASQCGIQTSYLAADGSTRVADKDVVLALLRSLEVPLEDPENANEILRARRLANARRILEPVVVQRTGRPAPVTVTLPEGVDPRQVRLSIELEQGAERLEDISARLVLFSGMEIEGGRYGLYRLNLAAAQTEPIPTGYHRLAVEGPGASASALLIVAPPCPRAPRAWGAFIPLHALRSDTDWGTGSYSDLADLGRFVSSLGASMLGSLPLYPCFLDPPADPSPYRPVSRLAYNELYIDPTKLEELDSCEKARRLLDADDFAEQIAAAHRSPVVLYEQVSKLRRQVLETLAESLFSARASRRRKDLDNFSRAHPELVEYARFRASRENSGGRCANGGETATDWAGEDPGFAYHLYCQFAAAEQLSAAGRALHLYADLPVGVHPDGFDPRFSPSSFISGARGGAPPDAFFNSGQDWGFPPLHPERIRQDDYGYFRAVLARAFRHAAFLRIDHVMGLQRLYTIPEGFDARHGAYVSYRAEELHALVSLEADRAGAVVVGEDLGTVPDEVRDRMASDQMLRSWVFQFESSIDEPLPEPPRDALASLGTHDLARFGAFLWGADIDEKQLAGQLARTEAAARRAERNSWRQALLQAIGSPAGLPAIEKTAVAYEGSLAHLGRSMVDLVLVDLEEIWDEREPQNRPGTGPEAHNWTRRASQSLAEICSDRKVIDVLGHLDQLRRAEPSKRGPK